VVKNAVLLAFLSNYVHSYWCGTYEEILTIFGGLKMFNVNKNKKWVMMIVAIVVPFVVAGTAQAGWGWLEKQKLLASDADDNDQFGISVSISGDYAIVGAPNDNDKGTDSGSAYIFWWDGTSWVQQAKLLASDGDAIDFFGYSVSISGDYSIVGAGGDDDKGNWSGSAYIFKREGAAWVQQAKLLASDGAAGDEFGISVSISGDHAIVGAYEDDDKGTDSGSAYIFKRDGETWSQQQKLLASDGAVEDYFGVAVSICDDLAIIGAIGDDDKGNYSGSAYIFKWTGTSWSQQAKLLASDGAADDLFGISVSISGDYAIVGADQYYNSSGTGKAYIFERSGANWVQKPKLTASDGTEQDKFGICVSISGDYAIVGAYLDDAKGSNSGSAYIFKRKGTAWVQEKKLLASDGAQGDQFGWSVSISGDYAIVGARGDDDRGNASGSAYLFQRVCPTADLSGDCFVDFADFAIMAGEWLQGD
jgi:hypothetical protein